MITSNNNPFFHAFNGKGLKAGLSRAFLSTAWIDQNRLEQGIVYKDQQAYDLNVSPALFEAIAEGQSPIQAICSYQIKEDGTRLAACKLFTNSNILSSKIERSL